MIFSYQFYISKIICKAIFNFNHPIIDSNQNRKQ